MLIVYGILLLHVELDLEFNNTEQYLDFILKDYGIFINTFMMVYAVIVLLEKYFTNWKSLFVVWN